MKRLQIHFSQRFGFIGGLAFAFVILVAHIYYGQRTEAILKERLVEKATFINTFLSFPFSLAINTKDDVSLIQVAGELEKQPDVLSVVLADYLGEVRYSADQTKIGDVTDDAEIKKVLQSGQPEILRYSTSGGQAMAFVAPLIIQGRAKPLGVVRTDMTFKRIDERMQQIRDSFYMYAIGVYIFCMTMTLTALRIWVSRPILLLKAYLQRLTPTTAEANLPEGSDEFGQLNAGLNELILKFKSEIQAVAMQNMGAAMQEGDLIRQLLTTLNPETRLVMADKDNQIVTDTDPAGATLGAHLLDLMHDAAFGGLVGKAFETEGVPAHAPVTLNEEAYQATVLRLPESFSKGIRTLILLNKNKETLNP
jgi:sensor histidine kinase regulating citrate/malate metabolism